MPTGWGAAVRAAGVAAGDTVVVYGAGGVGAAAVMGARLAGARHVVAVDPVALRRERAAAAADALVASGKRIRGALFGDSNPLHDIPHLLGRYRSGRLLLDELVTARYRLDQVHDGYADLDACRTVRGVILHDLPSDGSRVSDRSGAGAGSPD